MSTLNNITEAPRALPAPDEVMSKKVARAYPAGERKVAPPHPGVHIGSAIKGLGLSLRATAATIGVSHNALANVIKGDASITTEMALRIGTYFGNGPELWLNLQQDYDLWCARKALADDLKKIKPVKVEDMTQ